VVLVSGGSSEDPRTPPSLPGLPPPYLPTAVVGAGGATAGIDSYGDLVELRVPGPAGRPLLENPAQRQYSGTVDAGAGLVPQAAVGARPYRPLWRADSVRQRYRPGTNVLVTVARFGRARAVFECGASVQRVACLGRGLEGARVGFGGQGAALHGPLLAGVAGTEAGREASAVLLQAELDDRRRLDASRPLGPGAPGWAARMYERSLLAAAALTDRRTGAVAAGPRDGWAYVWPRDAGATAIALATSGRRADARRTVRFLRRLDLGAAARFDGEGRPLPGRATQGDAAGWVEAATDAAGVEAGRKAVPSEWRGLADYQEKAAGDYLGNALASAAGVTEVRKLFGSEGTLVRAAGDPASGADSAAAWTIRPFPRPALFAAARRTLGLLAVDAGPYGIVPSAEWPQRDPWTAPTAWTAWALAAAGDRPGALRMLAALRRAATPTGLLPERVDARTGVPRSVAPLAWSHAFAALALLELWPAQR